MNLLSHDELLQLLIDGTVRGADPLQVNSSSIDVTLGPEVLLETLFSTPPVIDLGERQPLNMHRHNLRQAPLLVRPGQVILACTNERFNLPATISAQFLLKSSVGRVFLEHMHSGWCDAWWTDSVLTLELKNMTEAHTIRLKVGDRIGQMIFFRHKAVAEERGYGMRGRYNHDHTVTPVKR